MKIRTVTFRWAWTSLAAIAVFAVLAALDMRLKAHTGYGSVDLQKVTTARDFARVTGAWIARPDAALAGFDLGFDYLFMPLYGFAFYYGALLARDAFAASGFLRRTVTLIAAVPLAGAILDAGENALETYMVVTAPTDSLAVLAHAFTQGKFICFYVGFAFWLLGIAGLFRRKKAAS